MHAEKDFGALAEHHHQREGVAELMNAVFRSSARPERSRRVGVPLAKPRVALSAASPRFAAGFPLQSLTRNAGSFADT